MPLFSKISGKIGDIVGLNLGGAKVLRAMPSSYNDANTVAQQGNRLRLAAAVLISSFVAAILKIGFASRPQNQSGVNAFTSANLPANFDANGLATWANLKFSAGSLSQNGFSGAATKSANNLTTNMVTANGIDGAASDAIYVIVWNTTINKLAGTGTGIRSAATIVTALQPTTAADVLAIYTFAHNPSTKKSSVTSYQSFTVV